MIPLVSSAEALALDRKTEEDWRLEEGVLMESAAQRLAHAVMEESLFSGGAHRRIVAAIGAGNNGGDALVLLRNLVFAGHSDCVALTPDRELKSLPARKAASLVAGGIPLLRWSSPAGRRALAEADLVIDGIAGTGLSGPLVGELADFVHAINEGEVPVFSIDVPSGFRDGADHDEPRIRASCTLSIEPRKSCLYAPSLRPSAGRILPIPGVFPDRRPALEELAHADSAIKGSPVGLLGPEDLPALRKLPSEWIHKGGRGRLAIFAGSPGMAGALFLAARAAQAAGAGLVTLFVRDELFDALRAAAPESIGGAILRPESAAAHELFRNDAVLAGPGWGRDASRNALLSFLLEADLPLVLDADALRVYAELPRPPRQSPLIFTPHPGEFESLSGLPPHRVLASPQGPLADLSAQSGACIALKSATTWIATPDGRFRVVAGGEAGLAVAGSGDVLAGLTAGLLTGYASRKEGIAPDLAFGAICLAVLVHLEAGRELRRGAGWFEASRLIAKAAQILGIP